MKTNTSFFQKTLATILLLCSIAVSGLFSQDRMYIYSSGQVQYQNNLTSIDSVIFYQKAVPPSLTTKEITNITTTTATSGGDINSNGGANITARGICWSVVNQNPTISDSKTTNGSGTGSFTSNITGLLANTTYYVRAYATNIAGTSYGNQMYFKSKSDGKCIANISPETWIEFMCYNLGVTDLTADPLAPSWKINGNYYQWGRNTNITTGTPRYGAAGPTGPGASETNEGAITGWNTTLAQETAWLEASKTAYDPCPTGYKVPTIAQWKGLIDNNQKTNVGAWGAWKGSPTNYATGIKFGENIFLPLLGARNNTNGALINRGARGYYWSSSTYRAVNAYLLDISADYYTTTNNYSMLYGYPVRCVSETSIPILTTLEATNITQTSLQIGGNITSDGGKSVTARGVCWSTSPNPTIGNPNYTTIDGTGAGSFTSNITGLTAEVTYYIRAYATNSIGTGYGSEIQLKAWNGKCGANINAGVWKEFMCHNLGVDPTTFPFTPNWKLNGDYYQWGKKTVAAAGPTGLDATQANDAAITGWSSVAATDNSWLDIQKTNNDPCPNGYRVPTKTDWEGLYANNTGTQIGTWTTGATNYSAGIKYGTSLYLPTAGARNNNDGKLINRSARPYYWSSTQYLSPNAYLFDGGSVMNEYSRANGYSVRCISTSAPAITTTVASNVTMTTITIGGNIQNDRGAGVTARGVCWSTSSLPTTSDSKTVEGADVGTFTSSLTNLTPGTTYYIRAYATNLSGTSYGEQIEVKTLWDSFCGAFLSPGVWTKFMCNNLGADQSASPFTPNWNINGDYYQWGIKTVAAAGPSSENFIVNSNDAAIVGWNTTPAPDGSWLTTSKTENDPCPSGYRIPTYAQWQGLIDNNTGTSVGNWIDGPTNYSVGVKFGEKLFLPVTGYRLNTTGALLSRGISGHYWSSNQVSSNQAGELTIGKFLAVVTAYTDRTTGKSVRCVSEQNALIPTLSTATVSDITKTTASCGGNITYDGGALVTERGVCWSTSQNPTITNTKTSNGTGVGIFTSTLNFLTPGTTYYVRAYATNVVGTAYGIQQTFTTTNTPSLTTTAITNVTESSATSGGNITNDGGLNVTARGVCWSTSQNPTTSNSKTIDGSDVGSFVSSITGLASKTTYYVRAYATNSLGTSYGAQLSFTTIAKKPTVETSDVTDVTFEAAVCGGFVSADDGANVTEYGVCWNTNQNPTIANSKTIDGSGLGYYTSSITGLKASVTYYVRAYATNSTGTSYGAQKTFSTLAAPPSISSTTAISNITITTAVSGGDIKNDGGAAVIARGVCWSENQNPTIADNKTSNGTGIGIYSANLTGLSTNTTYYVRAYATNGNGTAYGNQVQFTTVWDGTCSAFISPGVKKEFMCQNLGADVTADPFTPSWKLNGDYYQWGILDVAAAGPTGPDVAQENSAAITGWNTVNAANGSWYSNSMKTANDPCPKNYRVPTRTEWEGVVANNTEITVGTSWSDVNNTNYSSGQKLGGTLYLPAAGYRFYSSGSLGMRGRAGFYWSSTEVINTYSWYAWSLNISSVNVWLSGISTPTDYTNRRTRANSVRCIKE